MRKVLLVVLMLLIGLVFGVGVGYFLSKVFPRTEEKPLGVETATVTITELGKAELVDNIYKYITEDFAKSAFDSTRKTTVDSINNTYKLSSAYQYANTLVSDNLTCETFNKFKASSSFSRTTELCTSGVPTDLVNPNWKYNPSSDIKAKIDTALKAIYGQKTTYENATFKFSNNGECVYDITNQYYHCYTYDILSTCDFAPEYKFVKARLFDNRIEIYVKYLVSACENETETRFYYTGIDKNSKVINVNDIPSTVTDKLEEYGKDYILTFKYDDDGNFYWEKNEPLG